MKKEIIWPVGGALYEIVPEPSPTDIRLDKIEEDNKLLNAKLDSILDIIKSLQLLVNPV